MRIGKLNLTWWRKRPSVHIADVPLRAEDLPWFEDHRKGLPPFLARGMKFGPPRTFTDLPPMPIQVHGVTHSAYENQLRTRKKVVQPLKHKGWAQDW